MGALSFPTRLDEVTVSWLDGVLAAAGVLDGNHVTRFAAGAAAPTGRTASVHHLTLDYKSPGVSPRKDSPGGAAPRQLVAKFAAESPLFRGAAAARDSYRREVEFYRRFADRAGIPVPGCYAAEHDPDSDAFVLLLEHVDGAVRSGPGAVADVEAAVAPLAGLHARWWGRQRALDGILFEYGAESLDQHVRAVSRALERLPAAARERIADGVVGLLERWLASSGRIAEHCLRGPLTMCHGSFHREQLLHPAAAGGSLHVIDWQSVCVDCGPSDLARLLVTALPPELRRRHERRLLEQYHAHLAAGGVEGYDTDLLWEHYRLGIAKVLVLHVQVFAIFSPELLVERWQSAEETATSPSPWEALFGWPGRAAEDHQVTELLQRLGER